MSILTTYRLSGVAVLVATTAVSIAGAHAASAVQKECSAKYQAAKAANTLNGLSYNQFRKQCSAEAKGAAAQPATQTSAPSPVPAASTPTLAPTAPAPTPTAAPAPARPAPTTTAAAPASPPAAVGNTVFPTAISPSFASEKPGKAREKTCLAQYNTNKATNGNGGLKWIQKGGGYYSECNKRLKV